MPEFGPDHFGWIGAGNIQSWARGKCENFTGFLCSRGAEKKQMAPRWVFNLREWSNQITATCSTGVRSRLHTSFQCRRSARSASQDIFTWWLDDKNKINGCKWKIRLVVTKKMFIWTIGFWCVFCIFCVCVKKTVIFYNSNDFITLLVKRRKDNDLLQFNVKENKDL